MVEERQDLPAWVEREMQRPKREGARNDQLIKIGPTLFRCGWTHEEVFEAFQEMQPSLSDKEIRGITMSAARYAVENDELDESEYARQRKEVQETQRRAQSQLKDILVKYRWLPSEFTTETANWPLLTQRQTFIREMFKPQDVIWIGEVWETGVQQRRGRTIDYGNHFKTVAEWLAQPNIGGEFTAHSTFIPGTKSRANENCARRCYLVIESDVLSIDQVGAVFNYMVTENELELRAIVSTGGKSIHGWFTLPDGADDPTVMAHWGAELLGLSCDPATLKVSQPVRLPGCIRQNTRRPQQLLYLA